MEIVVYDTETMKELFLIGIYIPEQNEYRKWEISKWKNELDGFIRFVEEHPEHYWIGYNNLSFDSQIIEWILRNYENWNEIPSIEIAGMISQKAQG